MEIEVLLAWLKIVFLLNHEILQLQGQLRLVEFGLHYHELVGVNGMLMNVLNSVVNQFVFAYVVVIDYKRNFSKLVVRLLN